MNEKLARLESENILTPEKFQNTVNNLVQRIRRNARVSPITNFETLKFDELHFLEEYLYVVGEGSPIEEKEIYLASVSKIAIAYFAYEFFDKKKDTVITASKINVAKLYKEIVTRNAVELAKSMPSISFMFNENFSPEEFFNDIDFEVELNLWDIIQLSLIISSNHANTILKNSLEHNLRGSLFDKMKEIFPSYNMTISTENNAIWTQGNANTGYLSEMTRLLLKITELEPELAREMANNPIDFRFDFTHSEMGKKLIELGAIIDEKTGSYELGVSWTRNIIARGMPFYAPLLTVVTIILNGKKFSFGYYRSYELPFPDVSLQQTSENMQFKNSDGTLYTATVQFPDAENELFVGNDEGLRGYVQDFEDAAYPEFRNSMTALVKPKIEKAFGMTLDF